MKYLFVITALITTFYCKADFWTQKTDFPGSNKVSAFAFSIGNKAYVGGGFISNTCEYDFWEYDPVTDSWTRKADFPEQASANTVSFSIGNQGYVCTGTSGIFSRNMWQYDPGTDSWTQKPYFPGVARVNAVAFVIDSVAYVGTGTSSNNLYFQDFYAYNRSTNIWHAIAPLPDSGIGATGFSIFNKGYVIGEGHRKDTITGDFMYSRTLWQYDPQTDSWTSKASLPDSGRVAGASFTIDNMGYYGTGSNASGYLNDLWQYNPVTDTWTQKSLLPSLSGKLQSAYFSLGNKGYICFGDQFTNIAEVWEYSPYNIGVERVNSQSAGVKVFPNPFTNSATVTFSKELHNGEIIVSDIYGRVIADHKDIHGRAFILERKDMSAGIYFYTLKENGIVVSKDKIVIQ